MSRLVLVTKRVNNSQLELSEREELNFFSLSAVVMRSSLSPINVVASIHKVASSEEPIRINTTHKTIGTFACLDYFTENLNRNCSQWDLWIFATRFFDVGRHWCCLCLETSQVVCACERDHYFIYYPKSHHRSLVVAWFVVCLLRS